MSYTYTFPAVRGKQAGREYFLAMCPLRLIPKIFLFDEMELRPEIRAQRSLNRARIPEMAVYLSENPRDYVFSSLTASIDGEVEFDAVPVAAGSREDLGLLKIPMAAQFLLNDGQHRRAAIEEALKLRPELGEETISVVFFVDAGLRRSQQMFADLNRHAVRPTFSIGILYDHRDPLSKLAREVIERVSIFRDMVDKEKTSISNRSIKLFTLSGVYQATKALLGKGKDDPISEADTKLAVSFWDAVAETIPEWKLAQQRKIATAELREDRIHAHSVAIHAIAIMGSDLIKKYPGDWKTRLAKLSKVDWSRSNSQVWEGRALSNGRVSKAQANVRRTANYLKKVVGLTLTDDDSKFEVSHTGRIISGKKRRESASVENRH